MDIAQVAESIASGFAAAQPGRIVTRSFEDAPQRDDEQLEQGVVTVLTLGADDLAGPPDLADMNGNVRLLVLGQLKVAEDSAGHAIEDAELVLFDEIKAFADAPGADLCPFDLLSVALSGQLEHPYGWIRCEAVYAELD